MTIALRGFHAVVWSAHINTFPYLKGMSAIVLSWAFSPILSGQSPPPPGQLSILSFGKLQMPAC